MKKYIYSLVAGLTVTLCTAQVSISQAEYFWDADPGEGNGTAIASADGTYNSAFEKIAVSGIGAPAEGLHKFSVRVKDSQGTWGPAFTNIVNVQPATTPVPLSIAQAEYFWDADPGEGGGIALLAADGNYNSAFENIAISGLNAPSAGLHKFSARVKSNEGVWSPAFTNIVNVAPTTTPQPTSLAGAEYFWDNDPGAGNGIALPATDGNFDSAFENVAVSGLNAPSTGMHKFSVRVKNEAGVWSPAFTNIVYVEATTTPVPASLAAAEYFWDTDPGEGSGTPMLAADGNFNTAMEAFLKDGVPIVGPVGLHVFNVRVKDNQDVWGPVFKNVVYIETALSINKPVADEFYFYPNPATTVVQFSKEIARVEVYDMNGRMVGDSANTSQLNVGSLADGTYVLNIITAEGTTVTKKMIKRQ